MGRRFGRNQKRALTQKLREAQAALECRSKQFKSVEEKCRYFREAIENAAAVLGKYHIALPPQEVKAYHQEQSHFDLTWFNACSPFDWSRPAEALSATIDRIEHGIMRGKVTRDEITGDVHAIVRFPDGTNGYAVSKDDLRYLPPEYLTKQISRMIAAGIVKCAEEGRSR